MLGNDKGFALQKKRGMGFSALVFLIAFCMAVPVIQVMGQKSLRKSIFSPVTVTEGTKVFSPLGAGTPTPSPNGCSTGTNPNGTCPRTIGYWKNHETHLADMLEIGSIHLGDINVTTLEQALSILNNASATDARNMLRAQLLAAMLNRANGSDPMTAGFDVDVYISQGRNFLASHPDPVPGGHPDREQALFIKDKLDEFNNAPCTDRECDDFITGGGWILGTPPGAKKNFGVHGGIKNGQLWGGLNYIDHGTGMHVKSVSVTAYSSFSDVGREIRFNVTVDGLAATAIVRVEDNGEPGRNDTFSIQLSTGYSASGDLGGDGPGGGNIQLHRRGKNCNDNPPPPPPDEDCGRITIIKRVQLSTGSTSNTLFNFSSSARFGRTNFDLVDDDSGVNDRVMSSPIVPSVNPVTVTENPTPGWTLLDIVCVETVANTTVSGLTANIIVDPGEHVVCTFINGTAGPTAAHVEIAGRVRTAEGRGLSRAVITVTNATTGEARQVLSNTFGYYRMSDVEVGQLYVVNVAAKRYTFSTGMQTVMVQDNVSELDFVADPLW